MFETLECETPSDETISRVYNRRSGIITHKERREIAAMNILAAVRRDIDNMAVPIGVPSLRKRGAI